MKKVSSPAQRPRSELFWRRGGALVALAWLAATSVGVGAAGADGSIGDDRRHLTVDDFFALPRLSDPRLSPDKRWIAYVAQETDLEADRSTSRVWMVAAAAGEPLPMTSAKLASSDPRFSPDGKYLSFLSARDGGKTQVYTLFRQGGEAVQLTDTVQDVEAYEWSPDSQHLVLVLRDPAPEELTAAVGEQGSEAGADQPATAAKTPRPWVIKRLQFKIDGRGYLDDRRTHLYVFDVANRTTRQITFGDHDDAQPVWAPDSRRLAFVSNRTAEADSNYDTDVWMVDSADSAEVPALTRLSTSAGPDHSPTWSPDGRRVAFLTGERSRSYIYPRSDVAIAAVEGATAAKILTADLDRIASQPRFSHTGDSIYFLFEDAGQQILGEIATAGGAVERHLQGDDAVDSFDLGGDDHLALLLSRPHLPFEIFTYERKELQRRTFLRQPLLDELRLGEVESLTVASSDGTSVQTFVVKPPGFEPGRRYPTVLRIHGGPNSQYDGRFHFEAQLFAAHGYLVLLPNPRGSTGRGLDFSTAIWQSWGEKDGDDVLAVVDAAVARGWADPRRLAVGGWSYGGILTNLILTRTDRFRAAYTGASSALQLTNYGHDQYQRWWELELGLPWENRELWEALSPFYRVDKINTPTLILGGERDWNVPVINSEQLYQALRRLGVATELVVYPGEDHSLSTPSYLRDRFERYLAWYGRHLGSPTR